MFYTQSTNAVISGRGSLVKTCKNIKKEVKSLVQIASWPCECATFVTRRAAKKQQQPQTAKKHQASSSGGLMTLWVCNLCHTKSCQKKHPHTTKTISSLIASWLRVCGHSQTNHGCWAWLSFSATTKVITFYCATGFYWELLGWKGCVCGFHCVWGS